MRRLTPRPPRTEEPARSTNGDGRLLLAPREDREEARPPLRSRRLLQPIPLAGIALMLVGLLVVLGYSAAAARRTPVLVAAHNLPAGAAAPPSDPPGPRTGA